MPENETYPHAQAFPSDREDGFLGLTKREYIAIACLQGLLANSAHTNTTSDSCEIAVMYADTLIRELNK